MQHVMMAGPAIELRCLSFGPIRLRLNESDDSWGGLVGHPTN